MKTYLLKAADEDMDRWKAAAQERGMTFAAFVRHALDGVAGSPVSERSPSSLESVLEKRLGRRP